MNMRRKILMGVTAAALVLSSGVIAFAATDTSNSQIEKGKPSIMSNFNETQLEAVRQARTDIMKEAMEELVDNGTITQEAADQLSGRASTRKDKDCTDTLTEEQKTALREKTAAELKSENNNASNILTEEQKTALRETVNAKLENKLSALVSEGTITQDQADQLQNGKSGLHIGSGGRHGHGHGAGGKSRADDQSAESQDTTL